MENTTLKLLYDPNTDRVRLETDDALDPIWLTRELLLAAARWVEDKEDLVLPAKDSHGVVLQELVHTYTDVASKVASVLVLDNGQTGSFQGADMWVMQERCEGMIKRYCQRWELPLPDFTQVRAYYTPTTYAIQIKSLYQHLLVTLDTQATTV